MKKLISILLLSFYLIGSLGLPITVHYCGGIAVAVAVNDKPDCCCDNEEEQASDCCKDELKYVKIDNEQLKSEIELFKTKIYSDHFIPHTFEYGFSKITYDNLEKKSTIAFGKKDNRSTVPLYLLNSSFIYYS